MEKSGKENLIELTIEEAAGLLRKKEVSATEITGVCLKRIEDFGDKTNAFITVTTEAALKQAKESDERRIKGEAVGDLDGIPLAIKDNMSMEGVKTTAGSKILENYIAPYDATVVQRLKRQGAIILGKTNMDEFAMGSSTESSYFGPTRNPWDLERVPGGSSGGSAAGVAADMCLGALGSDTGGSIRQPAAFCGIVGLKPTYGAVSRYGLLAMASSLDQIGPMTKTVRDAQMIFKAIAGKDRLDSTSDNYSYKADKARDNLQGLKIGLPKEFFDSGLEAEVKEKVDEAIKVLEKAGAEIMEISLPHTDYALATYYILMPAEVSSNLARYDGIKYGLSKKGESLLDVYLNTRADGFGAEAKRRIMLGTYVLSAGYYEAYYKKAQQVRTLVKGDYDEAWKKVDVLATPVTPTLPFKIGEKLTDPLAMYLSDVMTVPINIAGVPAISVPCGVSDGLPIGLQLIGKPFDEATLFEVAGVYEGLRGPLEKPFKRG